MKKIFMLVILIMVLSFTFSCNRIQDTSTTSEQSVLNNLLDINMNSGTNEVLPEKWSYLFMTENLNEFISFSKDGGSGRVYKNDNNSLLWKDFVSNQKYLDAIKDKVNLPIIKSNDSDFKVFNIMLYPIAAYEFGLDKENDMRIFVKFLILEDSETDIELSELIKGRYTHQDYGKINFYEDTGVYGDYLYTDYVAGEESGQSITKVKAFFKYDDYLVEVFLGTYGKTIEKWDEKYFDYFTIEYADIK